MDDDIRRDVTLNRYRSALEDIASGAEHPRDIANNALLFDDE